MRSGRRLWRLLGLALMGSGGVLLAFAGVLWIRPEVTPAGNVAIRFSTTPAEAPVEAAAPLHVDATIDLQQTPDDPNGPRYAPFVDLQLLDAAGQPARFGGPAGATQAMHVTSTPNLWAADLSAPILPGTYHARLIIRVNGRPDTGVDLTGPTLAVVPAVAYQGGLVYSRNGNLWRSDANGRHTHQLTFYGDNGRADNPAWSPDGRRIAFTHALPAAADQIPDTEIWTIDPDGGSAAALAVRHADEDLINPTFAPGGALYFTSDRTFDPSTGATPTADRLTAAVESLSVEALDPGVPGGTRRRVVPAARMPNLDDTGRRLVYLTAPDSLAEGEAPVTHTLAIADSQGRQPRVLVHGGLYLDVYAPHLSPDGTQVAFAAVNPTGVPSGLNLWQQLGLAARPVAANGVPWDIYLVSANGGPITRLTQLSADLPFPAWSRDGRRLAVLTEKALYVLDLTQPTAPLRQVGPGSSHGQLAWYEP